MAKYKVLKSVAHNLGHSYLSLMNYVDGDYIVEHLFRQARETGETRVEIDVLAGTIAPAVFQTPVLAESVVRVATTFYVTDAVPAQSSSRCSTPPRPRCRS